MRSAKYAFADSLKRILRTRTLDHVTVTELVRECGTTRQAFYYHFDSIYDLLKWIYEDEADKLLANHKDLDTWQDGYNAILEWMRDNRRLVVNSCRSVNREYLENFLTKLLHPLLTDVIRSLARGSSVSEEDLTFITRFYTLALVSITLDWVGEGMSEDCHHFGERVELIMKDTFSSAIARFAARPVRRPPSGTATNPHPQSLS